MDPRSVTMNMGGMFHPIDMILIGDDKKVIKVAKMQVSDKEITVKDTVAVLEVGEGEGKGLEGAQVECTPELMKHVIGEAKEHENVIVAIISEKEVFKKGGKIDIKEEDVKIDRNAMQVLDDRGVILMNIKGGERIFSIKHTEQLVSLSKRIADGEAREEDLGKLMAKIIETQNTQKPEYV